jgi:hypothetical protein
LEVTFSFGNKIVWNRFEGNAICGIWGGYSQSSLIFGNTFKANGLKGYGEGGGINIEHGYRNMVSANVFADNSVAVKLWDDDDGALLKTPWALANHKGSRENELVGNDVKQSGGAAFWLRKTAETVVSQNELSGSIQTVDVDDASTFAAPPGKLNDANEVAVAIGDSRPVGARDQWWGREWIVMDLWGPVVPAPNARSATKRGVAKTPAAQVAPGGSAK